MVFVIINETDVGEVRFKNLSWRNMGRRYRKKKITKQLKSW